MLQPEEISRYQKQILLPEMGREGQERLKQARVLVVGAGGLGCPVLLYLAAAGVGTLGIADGDTVDISNLQRQVLYSTSDIGQPKAQVAAGKLRSLNPHTSIVVHKEFVNTSNVLSLIADYELVIDGSDNFSTRYLLSDACVLTGKPLVSGAIYKFEGQVSVFNFQGGPTYRCLFPEPPGEGESPNCAEIGVVATLPGIIGTLQANEAIKVITGIGEVLSGRLLVVDTLGMDFRTYSFSLVPANRLITTLRDLPEYCSTPPGLISYPELQALTPGSFRLIDVRQPEEHQAFHIGGEHIPLADLPQHLPMLDTQFTYIIYCASGARSGKAARLMAQHGFTVYSLSNGISSLPGL